MPLKPLWYWIGDEVTTPIMTRRRFLQGVSLAAPALLSATAGSPNETIQLGVIGIGPRARKVLAGMLPWKDVRCMAIADVQASRRESGKDQVDRFYGTGDCGVHRDFRELLDREDIDAVLIATGDRWHADASILAARAGKHVYSEKPCGITIDACRRLADAVLEHDRVFQAGTQRRSVPNFRAAAELARSGRLGRLHTLHASVYTPVLDNRWLPAEPRPPREECDWNLWLGPAPWRPYNRRYVDGQWRRLWDFDSGATLLDWGAHTLDLCRWAAGGDRAMPVEYEPFEDRIECRHADGPTIVLDFLKDPFGDRSPHYRTRLGTCPVRYEGDEGWVETGDSGGIVVHPASLQEELPPIERVRGLDVSAHSRDFLDAIRSGGTTVTNEVVMRHSHIACHAAAISWILGRKVRLDPGTERFVEDPEADLFLSRPSRNWSRI